MLGNKLSEDSGGLKNSGFYLVIQHFWKRNLELFELVSVSHKLGKFVVIKFHHNLLILCRRKGKIYHFLYTRVVCKSFYKISY